MKRKDASGSNSTKGTKHTSSNGDGQNGTFRAHFKVPSMDSVELAHAEAARLRAKKIRNAFAA